MLNHDAVELIAQVAVQLSCSNLILEKDEVYHRDTNRRFIDAVAALSSRGSGTRAWRLAFSSLFELASELLNRIDSEDWWPERDARGWSCRLLPRYPQRVARWYLQTSREPRQKKRPFSCHVLSDAGTADEQILHETKNYSEIDAAIDAAEAWMREHGVDHAEE